MLLELQCSEPGWLVQQGVGSPPAPACRVRFSACYEIKSQAGTEGLPVSSLKRDRPSHLDWGRLGVVRATGADNRW